MDDDDDLRSVCAQGGIQACVALIESLMSDRVPTSWVGVSASHGLHSSPFNEGSSHT